MRPSLVPWCLHWTQIKIASQQPIQIKTSGYYLMDELVVLDLVFIFKLFIGFTGKQAA